MIQSFCCESCAVSFIWKVESGWFSSDIQKIYFEARGIFNTHESYAVSWRHWEVLGERDCLSIWQDPTCYITVCLHTEDHSLNKILRSLWSPSCYTPYLCVVAGCSQDNFLEIFFLTLCVLIFLLSSNLERENTGFNWHCKKKIKTD